MGAVAVQSPRARMLEGALLGLVGVVLFSFSFPATKLALRGFDPWFISFGRAVLAAALAARPCGCAGRCARRGPSGRV